MANLSSEKRACFIHAKTRRHQSAVEQSRRIIDRAWRGDGSWYIAFSGGKDSTCLAGLIPDVPLVFSDDGWWLPETEAYINAVTETRDITWIRTTTRHTAWFAVNGPVMGKNFERSETGVFLGLRAEESAQRRLHLKAMGTLYFANNNQVWQCNPLAHWTVRDVWAYILGNDIPYNTAYDRYDELGIPMHEQRVGPFAVERVLGYGQLAILKRGWPDLFNRFATEHPEARLYV